MACGRGAVYSVDEGDGEWNESRRRYEDIRMLELSASELDAIVKAANTAKALAKELQHIINGNGIRTNTRLNGYKISFCGEDNCDTPDLSLLDGSLNIGCQCICAEDVKRAHAASLKARGIKA